jgi:hypothetical protein
MLFLLKICFLPTKKPLSAMESGCLENISI